MKTIQKYGRFTGILVGICILMAATASCNQQKDSDSDQTLLVLGITAAASSANSSSSSGITYVLSGSCQTSGADGRCIDYYNWSSGVAADCAMFGGTTYSASACTATNRVGSCTLANGISAISGAGHGVTTRNIMRYYSAVWNAGTAATNCSANSGATFN